MPLSTSTANTLAAGFVGGLGDFLTTNLPAVILTVAVLFGIGWLIRFTKRHTSR